MEQREINQQYQKWLTKLLGFDFDIECKAGRENGAADALSRIDVTATIMTLSVPSAMELIALKRAVEEDTKSGTLTSSLRNGQVVPPGYS